MIKYKYVLINKNQKISFYSHNKKKNWFKDYMSRKKTLLTEDKE